MDAFSHKRAYGKTAEAGGTFVDTVFVPFLPIWPLQSRLVLSPGQVVPLPLQWRSVLAAYARVWGGLLAALVLALAALLGADTELDLSFFTFVEYDDLVVLGRLALIFAPLAVFLAGYGWLGRPSLDELAQRAVYAKRCGHPVDVADGDLMRVEPLRESLRERAPALRSAGYRDTPDRNTAWREVASDPSLTDRAYLEDALAVMRCEVGAARGRERGARRAEHARVWKRLKALAPGLLDEARAYRPAMPARILRAAVVVGVTSIFAWLVWTTFAGRVARGYGRLSEVLSSRGPQVEERGFSFMGGESAPPLGEPVSADTVLRRSQGVFALWRPSAFAARRWYPARVVAGGSSGDVDVYLFRYWRSWPLGPQGGLPAAQVDFGRSAWARSVVPRGDVRLLGAPVNEEAPPWPSPEVHKSFDELVPLPSPSAPEVHGVTKAVAPAPVPVAPDDPLGGKLSLAEATEGLPRGTQLSATIETSMGKIMCKLFDDKAPITVANFVGLARGIRPWKTPEGTWEKKPAYDGTVFHRIVKGFIIQGGDPKKNGTGEPGYVIPDEVWEGATHDRGGLLCMANRGPNTNGAQFFITDAAALHLDRGYTIFGECAPVDLVHEIAAVEPRSDRAESPPYIKKVSITRK